MAGLDPATQRARVCGRKKIHAETRRSRRKSYISAHSAAPRDTPDSIRSLTLACWVAGSGPAMVIKAFAKH